MIQTTVKVSGMACAMCEAHINDAVRRVFSVKKVTSNHSKGQTIILSEEPLEETSLRKAINDTGYTAGKLPLFLMRKKDFSILEKNNFGIDPVAGIAGNWIYLIYIPYWEGKL